MAAYYNENDPKAAAWLRELIKAGLIADGEVDERSIVDVRPDDLRGFVQCHFFAGIGGWSYALRLAGWDDKRPVWTGSCPCQPFSAAGKGYGAADSRHLWPTWFGLIAECRPAIVFGEQVASADGLGWFDRVSTDMEGAHYAVGAVDYCAPGVGAFHIRQRLWFVADARQEQRRRREVEQSPNGEGTAWRGQEAIHHQRRREAGELVNASGQRSRWHAGAVPGAQGVGAVAGREPGNLTDESQPAGFWCYADWLPCRDGKARPVEPGTFPLAHGVPARVGRLRGYGNAIVPQVAAEVIGSYMDIAGVEV